MKRTVINNNKEIILMKMAKKGDLPSAYLQHYFTHILCHTGTANFRKENQVYYLKKNGIAIFLPTTTLNNLHCSRDFKATCFFASYDLMSKNNPDIGWAIKGYLFSKEHPMVQLSSQDAEKCLYNFQLLKDREEDDKHRFRKEILDHQLQIFVMDMWNIFSNEIEKRRVSDQEGSLFQRFLRLVEQNCMEEREVDFYSGKLFITSKYLTEVCKKSSGKTASEWIQNFTVQRLVLLLQNKNLSFTQIADTLNFSSQTFFSRYVRKVLGVSPTDYRLRMTAL